MIVTPASNIKEVQEFHELESGQVLYLGMILQNHKKVEITGFGGMATFKPKED
ncbi:MAG TPA: hypothetical protein GXX75_06890 [Clostridiales bacterium]|nr:hypothetical protein [Clostridiales bacterium]